VVCTVKGLEENKTLKGFVARIASEISHLAETEEAYRTAFGLSDEQLARISELRSHKDQKEKDAAELVAAEAANNTTSTKIPTKVAMPNAKTAVAKNTPAAAPVPKSANATPARKSSTPAAPVAVPSKEGKSPAAPNRGGESAGKIRPRASAEVETTTVDAITPQKQHRAERPSKGATPLAPAAVARASDDDDDDDAPLETSARVTPGKQVVARVSGTLAKQQPSTTGKASAKATPASPVVAATPKSALKDSSSPTQAASARKSVRILDSI
jgi:hypothetical protein